MRGAGRGGGRLGGGRPPGTGGEDEDRQEPKFHGPVYTVDYEEVPDSEDQKKDEGN